MRVRVHLGLTLALAGGAMLAYAGAVSARAAIARDRVRDGWEQSVARASRLRAERVAGTRAVVRPTAGAPFARLLIPAIALDEVVVEGVGNDDLDAGPGHMPSSATPGAAGNAVISAHRDRHFSRLDQVRVGDTLTTQTLDDAITWVVVSRRIVPREARALVDHGRAELALTTCWPMHWIGSAPDRLLLTARPLRREPAFAARQVAGLDTDARARPGL